MVNKDETNPGANLAVYRLRKQKYQIILWKFDSSLVSDHCNLYVCPTLASWKQASSSAISKQHK